MTLMMGAIADHRVTTAPTPPLAITHRLSNGTNTDGTVTTGTVSVNAGDLLLLAVSSGSVAGTTDAPTSLTGTLSLTWTLGVTVLMNSSLRGRTSIYWAPCPTTTSGTVTITFPGSNTSNCQWTFVTFTDADLTDPIVQTKTAQMAGTNPSLTLDTPPLADSAVFTAMHMNTNTTPTAGTDKTIIGTTFVGASPSVVQVCEYDLAPATAVNAFVSPSTANKGMCAVEIRSAIVEEEEDFPDLIADLDFPLVLAHRGGAEQWPEDTPYAFEQAFSSLPTVVCEGDLMMNDDDHLVMMHDTDVARVTASTGNVDTFTDVEWAALTVEWPSPPGGTPVPAGFLSDIIDEWPDRVMMLETSGSSAAVTEMISQVTAHPDIKGRIIAQAFNRGYCTSYAAAGFYTVQIYGGAATIDLADDVARGMWAVGMDKGHADMDATFVTDAHALGLKVFVYTVDTLADRNTLFGWGVDAIFTDLPSLMLAPPVPVMQTRSTGGVTTGTSMTVTLPSGITTGDLILVTVGGSRTNATPTTVLSGYTKLCENFTVNGSSGGFLSVWGKIATASESDPSFSVTNTNTNMTYVAERWSGVHALPATTTAVGYATTSPAMTSATVTTTIGNSIVLTAIGGRGLATGVVSPSWGGGAAAAYNTASGRIGFNQNGTDTVDVPATVTHTCSITNTQGAPVSCIGSVVLVPAH